MKILASCYACSPYQGSEPGMGWMFVKALSKQHYMHIITESKFRPDIERYFEEHEGECENLNFHFIKKDRNKTLRKIWPPSYYWFYKKWQKKAYKLVVELDKQENFDVIHQLNMIGYREPGYLWKIDKPLVWGPIGGFQMTPWCMLPSMGIKAVIFYGLRNLINLWQMRFSARVRIMARRADYIISSTQDSYKIVTQLWHRESRIIPEVGYTAKPQCAVAIKEDKKICLCWSGIHVARKSLHLLLSALAICKKKNDIILHIIGKGEQTAKWQKLANSLKLENVVWHGWIPRQEATKIMMQADIFIITSMSEDTSTVLLEALSFGIPVIAPNLFGFSNVITDDCGVKIDVSSKNVFINQLSIAIDNLCTNTKDRQRLAVGALRRAEEFSFTKKVEEISDIYAKIIKHK